MTGRPQRIRPTAGFTLIELLVVIAIIGLLSSVVLASLNTARQKAQIAANKSNLIAIQTQAELLYDNPNMLYGRTDMAPLTPGSWWSFGVNSVSSFNSMSYAMVGTVFANQTVVNALTKILEKSATLYFIFSAYGTSYAVAIYQPTTSNWWCIDSAGNRMNVPDNPLSFGPIINTTTQNCI